MILELAKENGYYTDYLDNLKYRLTEQDGKWCISISHPSGRDFYDYKPIEYMSDYEIEQLRFAVWEDMGVDYPDSIFNTIWNHILENPEAIAELAQAGYHSNIDMEGFREFLDTMLFENLFDYFVKQNQA
jgi:hypothetical protein